MRWIWIDRILELERGSRCVAIKNVSAAEDVLHDHFPSDPATGRPAMPVMPNPLIIEGMAQTAGILVGHAGDFKEKVILAKISRARFTAAARPGYTLRYTATLERITDSGASTTGIVELIDPASPPTPPLSESKGGASVGAGISSSHITPLATIDLVFSHIDQNRSGLAFPEHNFVFTSQFMDLLRESGIKG